MNHRNDVIDWFDAMNDPASGYEDTVSWDFWHVKDMLEYINTAKIKREWIHLKSMRHQIRRDKLCALTMVRTYKRIQNANTYFPIIIHRDGTVLDWHHRIVKAILEWKKHIKAYRIDVDLVKKTIK